MQAASAADPGAWGNNLSVTVDVGTPGTVLATDDVDSFHLTIDEIDPVVEAADGYEQTVFTRESHPNVSIDPTSSRDVVTRLAQHSALARLLAATAMPNPSRDAGLLPAAAPAVTFRDGSDGLDHSPGRGGVERRIRGIPERECRVLLSEGNGDRPAALERGALLRAVRGGGRAYRPHRPDPRGLESASRHRHDIVRGQRPRVRAH